MWRLPRARRKERKDRDSLHIDRSEEHTSELQSQSNLVCRLLLEKKNKRRAPASVKGMTSRHHDRDSLREDRLRGDVWIRHLFAHYINLYLLIAEHICHERRASSH